MSVFDDMKENTSYEEGHEPALPIEPKPDDIPIDAPLYKCVWKKSKSVAKLFGKAIAIFAGIIAAIAVACALVVFAIIPGIIWLQSILVTPIETAIAGIANGISGVWAGVTGFIAALPIWLSLMVIIISSVAFCIMVYSLWWCIDRKLTKEDRDSKKDNIILWFMASCAIITGYVIGSSHGYIIGYNWYPLADPITRTSNGIIIAFFGAIVGCITGLIIGVVLRSYPQWIYNYWKRTHGAKP